MSRVGSIVVELEHHFRHPATPYWHTLYSAVTEGVGKLAPYRLPETPTAVLLLRFHGLPVLVRETASIAPPYGDRAYSPREVLRLWRDSL